jgi:exonuclease SbcC
MRIVAVRGQNLASIGGLFEIDFDNEPIRDAGIFAITGPTGAGKTTVLDAICLALYNSLPRMDTAERGIRVGSDTHVDQQANYDDVRGILRHGAGSAFAEVDFVGQDRIRYRARWEVRRAHNRPDGKLQGERIVLWDLDKNQRLGEKNSDTLQEIARRAGLRFDQFRRSALLAQGDFDAFVRAKSRERAELLERITGTEIYSRLSIAAFQRAKLEQQGLETLETQMAEYHLLGSVERAGLEAQIRDGMEAIDQATVSQAQLHAEEKWYSERSRLALQLQDAEEELEARLDASQGAEADRKRLEVCRKALAARAEIQAAAQARAKRESASLRLQEATEQRDRIREAFGAAHRNAETASRKCEETRTAYEEIGLQLDEAKRLDAIIEEKKGQLAKAKAVLKQAEAGRDSAKAAFASAEKSVQLRQQQRNSDSDWLKQNAFAEILAYRTEELATDLSHHAQALESLRVLDPRAAQARNQVARLAAERQSCEESLGEVRSVWQAQAEQLATAGAAVDQDQRVRLESLRDSLAAAQSALQSARAAADKAATAASSIAQEEREQAQQLDLKKQAEGVIATAGARIPETEARLEEARRRRELSEAAESKPAELLRMKLTPGEPCPVCGSPDHHLREVDRKLKARAEQDRRRVRNLEEELADLNTRQNTARAQRTAAADAAATSRRKKAKWQSQLKAARSEWQIARFEVLKQSIQAALRLPALPAAAPPNGTEGMAGWASAIKEAVGQTAKNLRDLSNAETHLRKMSRQCEKLRGQMDKAAQEVDALKESENKALRELAGLNAEMREKQNAATALRARLNDLLGANCPGWEKRAESEGVVFASWCREQAGLWRECKQRVDTADADLQTLVSDRAACRATLEQKGSSLAACRRSCEQAGTEVAATTLERSGVIGGRDPRVVRTEHRLAWEMAEKNLRAAQSTLATRSQEQTAAQTKLDHAEAELAAAKQELGRAEEARAASLKRHGITLPEAVEALARDETWINREQERLNEMATAIAGAGATVAERKRTLTQHEGTGAPAHDREGIPHALEEIAVKLGELNAAVVGAKGQVKADDDAQARVSVLRDQYEIQAGKARLWARMNELIGSADGAKFRRFAQALTFHQLIGFANRHLAEFKPRYELQRAPGSDLGLQVVDHDMADEVRGVHNLSGGERFLVSLALALGLASMSSNRGIQVESLFIDEGFGSLDSSSLDVAISALERLQAGGRRIGLISHVEELKERIPVRIEVCPQGGGRSSISITAD